MSLSLTPSLEQKLADFADDHRLSVDQALLQLLEQAEQENQIFQRLFNLSVDILCIASMEGYFKRINPAFTRTLGYTEAELLDQPFMTFVHPEDRESTRAAVDRLASGLPIINFENRYRHKNGSYRWISWASAPLLETGEIYAVARDVTDFKQTQLALSEANQQVKTILDSIRDAFFALDDNWHFTYVNPEAEKLLEQSRDELLGKSIWDVFSEAVGTTFYTEYQRVMRDQTPAYFVEYYEPLGIWFDVSAYPADTGISVYFRNVNERKEAEETRQITVALRQELQKEQELRDLRAQFISMVTHDLRNPLAGAYLTVANLEKSFPQLSQDAIHTRFQTILEQLKVMDDLIEDLLVFSSIERGKLHYHPTEINIDYFCSQAIQEVRTTLGNQHHIICENRSDHQQGYFDKNLMYRVMTNLLSNAIKYSPIDTTIQVQISSSNGDLKVSVRDEGIGIPDADQPYIFEAFRRASNAKDKYGTGLGLAIVKRIVELHNGEINFVSEVNRGTTFTVRLPLHT